MKTILANLAASLAIGLSAFVTAAPAPITQTINEQTDGYILRISGSNTLGAQALPAVVEAYLEAKQVNNVSIVRLDQHQSSMVRGTAPDGQAVNVLIEAQGSSTGFSSLINGTADIAAASRPVTDDENARFANVNLTDSRHEHIVALDGIAIVVHQSNPISTLSVDQIGKIFSGEITRWSEISVDETGRQLTGLIQVYSRSDTSGTFDTFKSIVLNRGYQLASSVQRLESNNDVLELVNANPNAIGFTSVASADRANRIKVSDGDSTALAPEKMYIAAEDYPLARRLYLYNLAQTNPHVAEFLAFVNSSAAQDVIEQTGFTSQNIITLPQTITAAMPSGYLQLVGRAERLSLNLRFQGDSRRLDNKALSDISRLVAFMQQPENSGRDLLLFGFSADQGNDERERLLSEVRMLAVRKELRTHGINAKALKGYGDLNPVASNENPIAAERNNRVELWIKER